MLNYYFIGFIIFVAKKKEFENGLTCFATPPSYVVLKSTPINLLTERNFKAVPVLFFLVSLSLPTLISLFDGLSYLLLLLLVLLYIVSLKIDRFVCSTVALITLVVDRIGVFN